MGTLIIVILTVMAVAILGIVLIASFGMPVAFAGIISALGIGVATAAIRYWPK